MTERPFPWNRKVFALLLDRLFAAGARVVALDFLFLTENEGDPDLRAALERHRGHVVIGWSVEQQSEEWGRNEKGLRLPSPTVLPGPAEEFSGFVFHHADIDGVLRRVDDRTSELRETKPEIDPQGADKIGFAAMAVRQATGREPPAGFGRLINFQGGERTYPYLPLADVLSERVFRESRVFEFGNAFRDKIVFVGPTANTFHDIMQTPFGEMAGVETHAQIAADLLAGTMLRESPTWADRFTALVCALLPALVVLRVRGAMAQTALLAGLVAAFFGIAQGLFHPGRIVIPMFAPLCGLIGTGGFGIVYQWLLEQFERARLRNVLNVHLSKSVADVILVERDSFEQALLGTTKRVTTLFSDIRNFTEWSESVGEQELVAQINEYFLPMVDAILDEDGTPQRFIGDAILAVWGDTHTHGEAEDAIRAVRSALVMRTALVKLNEGWRGRPDRRELTTGIGINHGKVIVGEVGHPVRRQFTVMGDAINLAARLESATKQFHADILIGPTVEEMTRAEFVHRRVDRLVFKGKTQPVEVFIPLSDLGTPPPPWLADYHRAIDLYRARSFAEAAELFAAVNAAIGGGDFLCTMYAGRCAAFAQTPPPTDWNGVHVLAEK
jgi:adenylate cyclase